MISGFDRAVFNMEVGEKRSVRLEPMDAYGEWREDFVTKPTVVRHAVLRSLGV